MMELQKTKGKPFVASSALVGEDDALMMPHITGDTLTNVELSLPAALHGNLSLVALSFKQFGFVQLASWVDPFVAHVEAGAGAGAAAAGGGGAPAKGNKKARRREARDARAAAGGGGGGGAPQVVQVSAIDAGFIANLLKGSMITGLKQSIDVKRHDKALVFIGDTDAVCDR